jgi:prevent-host-death family protein
MAESSTRIITGVAFHRTYGAVLDAVANHKATVIVTSHGRPHVAIVAVDEYEALMEARRQLAWTRLARLTGEPTKEG